MCILFVKINENPDDNQFRVVLANIRDEFYSRPTQVCSFWSDSDLIGGKDLQRGGTWLAMNRQGKIGVLLNVLQPNHEFAENKKSRGLLVVDYLQRDCSPHEYLEEVYQDSSSYNGFLLVTLKVDSNGVDGKYFSNFYNINPLELNCGTYAFGNNLIPDQKWPKVCYGQKLFEEILNKYGRIEAKEKLIEEIFNLFADKTRHPLDEQMKQQGQGKPEEVLESLSAIYVQMPNYGSRTWSVILIDAQGNVDFVEKTMKEPIKEPTIDGETEWITTTHSFHLTR